MPNTRYISVNQAVIKYLNLSTMKEDIVTLISRLLKRFLKAKGTRAPAYSRALRRIKGGFTKTVVKRSSGPISRGPGGDRVAVKVDVETAYHHHHVQLYKQFEEGNF